MTPVPWEACLSMTLLAPYTIRTSCGIVVPTIGMRIRFFFASSTPLRIDSGTSPALPRPTPTWPCPSPTTTTALKLNRRPPLTTLATRLIWTTRSSSASLLGSMRATSGSFRSELEAGFAGGIGERLDPPVGPEPGSIEDDALDAGGFCPLGGPPPHDGRFLGLGRLGALQLLLDRRGGGERRARRIVDDLRVDVVEAAEHRETRPHLRPRQVKADPVMALASCGAAGGELGHRVRSSGLFVIWITSCRRSSRPCRPCGGCTRPNSARPCPYTALASESGEPSRRSARRAPCRCRPPRGGSGSRPRR